jgi:hypothetical protein
MGRTSRRLDSVKRAPLEMREDEASGRGTRVDVVHWDGVGWNRLRLQRPTWAIRKLILQRDHLLCPRQQWKVRLYMIHGIKADKIKDLSRSQLMAAIQAVLPLAPCHLTASESEQSLASG